MTDKKPLYKPFKSKAKNKKYSVYVMKDGKKKLFILVIKDINNLRIKLEFTNI